MILLAPPSQLASAARPLDLHAYESLGQKAGYVYVGTRVRTECVSAAKIPSTFFTETAVFKALDGQEETVTSYYKMSLALQRRQPTLVTMRSLMRRLTNENDEPPTLAILSAYFPGTSSVMLSKMYHDLFITMPLEEWCLQASAPSFSALSAVELEDKDDDDDKEQKNSKDSTKRAQQLAGENLQFDLVDLTHAYSTLDRSSKRKPLPLFDQPLEKNTTLGYEVAVHRGDAALLVQYVAELERWSKQQYRLTAVKCGELLPTGEDSDLQVLYEHLPLQKDWLLFHGFEIAKLDDAAWLDNTLTVIGDLKHRTCDASPSGAPCL